MKTQFLIDNNVSIVIKNINDKFEIEGELVIERIKGKEWDFIKFRVQVDDLSQVQSKIDEIIFFHTGSSDKE